MSSNGISRFGRAGSLHTDTRKTGDTPSPSPNRSHLPVFFCLRDGCGFPRVPRLAWLWLPAAKAGRFCRGFFSRNLPGLLFPNTGIQLQTFQASLPSDLPPAGPKLYRKFCLFFPPISQFLSSSCSTCRPALPLRLLNGSTLCVLSTFVRQHTASLWRPVWSTSHLPVCI